MVSGDIGVSGGVGVGQVVLAGLVRRALTRAADAVLMLALGLVGALVASVVVGLLAIPFFGDFLLDQGAGAAAALMVLWMVLMALALVPVYRYEVVPTARRGQTFGKQAFSTAVVCCPYRGELALGRRRSRIRWAVPHGAFVAAGAAGTASSAVLGVWGLVVGAGAAAAGWTAVYASVLLDDGRRGWHDKLAGTVVVSVGDDGTPLLATPDAAEPLAEPGRASAAERSPRLRIAVGAVIVAVAAATAAAAVSTGAYMLVSAADSLRVDKYDDTIRGTHTLARKVAFGQRIGPDGDGCWPENSRDSNVRVFCDLVSIGGLHWDAGDVRVADSVAIFMGSGYMCLVDVDSAPWCWEWSPDVQPRPARVPEAAVFRMIVGAAGLVCGQTPDYQHVMCWTVGVDQREYRQATHRFTDGSEWDMSSARDDPPRFRARERGTGRGESFHAFTGEQRSGQLMGQMETPRLLETETTP